MLGGGSDESLSVENYPGLLEAFATLGSTRFVDTSLLVNLRDLFACTVTCLTCCVVRLQIRGKEQCESIYRLLLLAASHGVQSPAPT